jgi:uncharacterized protein YjbJ (UPF0337 family)
MNRKRIEGDCKQPEGKLQEQPGKITGDEPQGMAGRHAQLAVWLQAPYRFAKLEAERQEMRWESDLGRRRSLLRQLLRPAVGSLGHGDPLALERTAP